MITADQAVPACIRGAVELEQELQDAVSSYATAEEINLAIANTKVLAGLAKKGSDRALCLSRLVALHSRRRVLGL